VVEIEDDANSNIPRQIETEEKKQLQQILRSVSTCFCGTPRFAAK